MIADPMVGYWCRVGSLALTHTHNDIAILVQRRTLLSIFFCYFPSFSLPSMSFVCCRFLVVAECDKFARLSTVEREPVLCAGLDIPCGLHLSTALLMTFVAAQDHAEGWLEYAMSSLPSSVERITRLEITWTVGQALSWAFFSRWFGMDPADNLNLIQPVNPWSGSAWSICTGLQRTTAIPGVIRCWLDRHSTERWCTAPLSIRTPLARRLWRQARRALRSFSASLERSSSCYQGRFLATRTLEMARSASETLLSSATAWTSRFSSMHHAWDHTTVFFSSAAPAAVVATPSAVVVPAPALSYFLCFPTVSAATAPV